MDINKKLKKNRKGIETLRIDKVTNIEGIKIGKREKRRKPESIVIKTNLVISSHNRAVLDLFSSQKAIHDEIHEATASKHRTQATL